MSSTQKAIKLALAMIVKGSDEEAARLRKCLSLTAQWVDGIFITITQPNEAVEMVCKEYKTTISHFEWCNDFSKARNFNFEQVPREYTHILWLDADDGLRGADKLKSILAKHPDVDTYIVNYLYAFDDDKNPTIVHMKTQIVKNDGCVTWVGAIHENLESTRDINPWFLKDIDRIHLSDEKHSKESSERNLEIAKIQIEKSPNDPTSWWNLGNAYRGMSRFEDSLEAFDKFLASSMSDEEKYLARLRRAECFWALGKKQEAIAEAQYAIGLKPEYPDAYHVLGTLYMQSGLYENAIKSYLSGLVKKPPKYSILVYNPRDYDYTPLKNLAKAYWMVSRPDMALPLLQQCLKIMPDDKETEGIVSNLKEETKIFNKVLRTGERLKKVTDKKKLKKAIERLPVEVQAHPAIAVIKNANFFKEKSSGKDMAIYCGNTGEVWNPETARTKGIGGSEEAVIWISKLLAQKGWNIEVYANCGTEDKVYDGVKWRPFWTWNVKDKQDVVVLWRHPQPLKFDINAKKIYVDLHDVIKDGEFTPERIAKITKVFVKSEFHKSLFPSIPADKFVVVSNGIDPSIFEDESCPHKSAQTEEGDYDLDKVCNECPKRDKMLMINTSSAERSLPALLDCFEEIKKQVPEAKLKWAYGWGTWDLAHSGNPKMMAMKEKLITRMKDLGVEELGRISHGEVAELYKKANIFAYPSEFAEIDCISLSKAMAAGAIPITSDFAAMGDKQGHGGVFIHSAKNKDNWVEPYQIDFSMKDEAMKKKFVNEAVGLLLTPQTEGQRESMRNWARYTFAWDKVAEVWDKELSS